MRAVRQSLLKDGVPKGNSRLDIQIVPPQIKLVNMSKKQRLTLKQKKFLAALPKAKNYVEAVRLAGYSDTGNSAHAMAYHLTHSPHIRERIDNIIAKGNYDEQFKKTWDDILSSPTDEEWVPFKLKVIDQISKLSGLMGNKPQDNKSYEMEDFLPKAEVVGQATIVPVVAIEKEKES